ncbi:MAG TPA: hypothetical protein VF587_12330 [Solirubrobacteraceae bacterium]
MQPGAISAPAAVGADFPTPSWTLVTSPVPPDPGAGQQWTGIVLAQAGTLWVHATGDTPTPLFFVAQGEEPQPIAMDTDVSFQASVGDGIVFAFASGSTPGLQLNWGFS